MKPAGRTTLYVLCLALTVCTIPFAHIDRVYASTVTQSQLDEATDAYEDTKDRIEKTAESIDAMSNEHASLQETLDNLNVRLSEAGEILEGLQDNIDAKQREIDTTWGRIEELATQIADLEQKADEQYEQAKEQIKYAYESGDALYMAILLGRGSYADYINRTSYMEMFVGYHQNTINNLIETGKNLKETRSVYEQELVTLEEEKADLDEYRQTVRVQEEEIHTLVNDTSVKVEKYADEIDDAEKRLKEYEEQLSRQEDDIETLRAKLEEEKKVSAQAAVSEWRDISQATYSESDRKLMANIIWCEAGNEQYTGQVAVGAVIMNRVMSSVFPDTIVGVVYQKGQFTPASSGRLALALSRDSADESCYRAADAAMSGVNNIGNCLYFRTPTSAVNPKYVIGNHYFY